MVQEPTQTVGQNLTMSTMQDTPRNVNKNVAGNHSDLGIRDGIHRIV